jgi:hypothetical protein
VALARLVHTRGFPRFAYCRRTIRHPRAAPTRPGLAARPGQQKKRALLLLAPSVAPGSRNPLVNSEWRVAVRASRRSAVASAAIASSHIAAETRPGQTRRAAAGAWLLPRELPRPDRYGGLGIPG